MNDHQIKSVTKEQNQWQINCSCGFQTAWSKWMEVAGGEFDDHIHYGTGGRQ